MNTADLVNCETCSRTHHKEYVHASDGYEFRCMRCQHEWRTKVAGDIPEACSKCHSAYWDRPHSGRLITPGKVRRRRKAQVRIKTQKVVDLVLRSGIEPPPSVRMGR